MTDLFSKFFAEEAAALAAAAEESDDDSDGGPFTRAILWGVAVLCYSAMIALFWGWLLFGPP